MTAPHPAPAAGTAPKPEWAADGSTTAFVVRGLVLVAVGGFLGGLVGAGVAAVGVLATWQRSARAVAAGSAALLVGAAFATVFEVTPEPGTLRSNFADVRPIASALGLAAGILAIVAVVTFAFRERATAPAADVAPVAGAGRAGLREQADTIAAWCRAHAALLGVGAATFVVRAVLAPAPLTGVARLTARNLRSGAGYVTGVPGAYRPTGAASPVPTVLAAFGPGGGRLVLLWASVAAVVLAMTLAQRLAGSRAATIAGIGVLVVQVATAQRLPSTLASALLLAAFLVSMDDHRPARSVLAGVALGLAVLSVPWTILAAPLLMAWIGFGRSREHPGSVGAAALALGVALLTGAPWQRYLVDRFATWAPSTDMGLDLATITAFAPLAVVALAVFAESRSDR